LNSLIHILINPPITGSGYKNKLPYIQIIAQGNGFNNRIINKLLYKQKQNAIATLEAQKERSH
jgi:hypothetical protein